MKVRNLGKEFKEDESLLLVFHFVNLKNNQPTGEGGTLWHNESLTAYGSTRLLRKPSSFFGTGVSNHSPPCKGSSPYGGKAGYACRP